LLHLLLGAGVEAHQVQECSNFKFLVAMRVKKIVESSGETAERNKVRQDLKVGKLD
jgi:hypothetical protein